MADNTLLKSLADIGFMASSNNMPKHAFAIFHALELARPDSPIGHIGIAFQYMNKKLHQDALDILHKKALPLDEDNPATKAFIGMCLMYQGRNKECEDILNQAKAGGEPESASMAEELLVHMRQG